MATVGRRIAAGPEDVWATLADGWLYPLFVVGASRMREVDDAWPAEGAELRHSFGVWPLLVDDTTVCEQAVAPQLLRLTAQGRPLGEAAVLFVLTAVDSGTEVTLEEDVVSGPGRLLPAAVRGPLIAKRNEETLRRLALVVENRTRPPG